MSKAKRAPAAARRALRRHYAKFDQISESGEQSHLSTLPDELLKLTCGAKTRLERPCRITSLYSNGRCKLHGGLSTGPKTAEGRAKALANLRRGPSVISFASPKRAPSD